MKSYSYGNISYGNDAIVSGKNQALTESATGPTDDPSIVDLLNDRRIGAYIDKLKGAGLPISDELLSSLGEDFADTSDVLIHTDISAIFLCEVFNARAFAYGNDIFFNQGEFEPLTQTGKKLLVHELTHVLQQKGSTEQIQRQVKNDTESKNNVDITYTLSQAIDIYKFLATLPLKSRSEFLKKNPKIAKQIKDLIGVAPTHATKQQNELENSSSDDLGEYINEKRKQEEAEEEQNQGTNLIFDEDGMVKEKAVPWDNNNPSSETLSRWAKMPVFDLVVLELGYSWKEVNKEFEGSGSLVSNLFIKDKIIKGWRPGDGKPEVVNRFEKEILYTQAWTLKMAWREAARNGYVSAEGKTFVWEAPWISEEVNKVNAFPKKIKYDIATNEEAEEYLKAKAIAKKYNLKITSDSSEFLRGTAKVKAYKTAEAFKAAHQEEIDKIDAATNANPKNLADFKKEKVTDPKGNTLPGSLYVKWFGDDFKIDFRRKDAGYPQIECEISYIGSFKVDGVGMEGTSIKLSTMIGTALLDVSIIELTDNSLLIDLYSDNGKLIRIKDAGSLDTRMNMRRRVHDFDLDVNGQNVTGVRVWVHDPNAKEIAPKPKENLPGTKPVFSMTGKEMINESIIDGDGDQYPELKVVLKASEHYADSPSSVKKLDVNLIQLSSSESKIYSFAMPKQSGGGSLFPIIKEVTDGGKPTRVSLSLPMDTNWMDIVPVWDGSTMKGYNVTVGGSRVFYSFAKEKKGVNDVFKEKPGSIIGNIISIDMEVGAFKDKYRFTISPISADKAVVGLSPMYKNQPLGGQGITISIKGKLSYSVLKSTPVSFALDLDGDGKEDMLLHDFMQEPDSIDGGGPAQNNRNHTIRLSGSSIGKEELMYFKVRGNSPIGSHSRNEIDKQAAFNAVAIDTLKEQQSEGSFGQEADLYELAMMKIRKKAADRGFIKANTFNAWAELSLDMIVLRANMGGITPELKNEFVKDALGFYNSLKEDTRGKSEPIIGSQYSSENKYTNDIITSAPLYSDVSGPGKYLQEALKGSKWSDALKYYRELVSGFDLWVIDNLKKNLGDKNKEAQQAELIHERSGELSKIAQHNPKRLYAVFCPDEKMKDEPGYVSQVPLALYTWKEGSTWHLKDLTNPKHTYDYKLDSNESNVPFGLLQKLNDPDHFPEGRIRIEVPGERGYEVKTTYYLTWKMGLTYLGLGLAGVGLALSTFGTGTVAVVGLWAMAGSAVVGATSSAIDLAEHIDQGNLDATTAMLDIANIVGSLAGASALAMGRIVKVAGAAEGASKWTGNWARLAMLADKYYIPATVTSAGADVMSFAVLSYDAVVKLDQIENGAATPDEKKRAKLLLLSQMALMGSLTALSVKGATADIKKGKSLTLYEGPGGVPAVADSQWYFGQIESAKSIKNIDDFKKSVEDWRFGKNNMTWDEYFQNLVKKYPNNYDKIIEEVVKNNPLGLTKSEAYAIFNMTTVFHQVPLNKMLREGNITPKVIATTNMIDSGMQKLPVLPGGTKYYRGIKIGEAELTTFLAKHKKGETVDYVDYLFAGNNRKDAFIDNVEKNIKITMITKENGNGRTIHDLSFGKMNLGTKDEAMFLRGSKFKVVEVDNVSGNVYEILLKEL